MASNKDEIEGKASEVAHEDVGESQTMSWDSEAEKKLRRKCDRHVLPCITLLLFMSFLDRTNIGEKTRTISFVANSQYAVTEQTPGNARIQGMVEDLNMTGHDYNIALFIFFVSYILFEVPSNIIIKRIAPSTWFSIIMVTSCLIVIMPKQWICSKADFCFSSDLMGHRYCWSRPGQ